MATLMDPARRLYVETYHMTTKYPILPSKLETAARTLAEKHSTLRSILCQTREQLSTEVLIAVLDPNYVRHNARLTFGSESLDMHLKQCRATLHMHGPLEETTSTWSGELPWKVSVSPLPGSSRYRLTLSYHHALMDGTSARQLLQWIHQEIKDPGSVMEASDYMSIEAEMAAWRTPNVEVRLRQRYAFIQKASRSLEEKSMHQEPGSVILARRISTIFGSHNDRPAVPAWMGRLALSLTLCAFEDSNEAVFHETMSARKFLVPESRQAMGPLLMTQPRLAKFHGDVSLARVAQSLKSSNDIPHSFTAGELRSLIPSLGQRLHVSFVCQTNDSYFGNAVRDWEESERETFIDMPLLVELMPPQQGTFVVHLHYRRELFSQTTMALFQDFFCEALEWLQTVHTQLSYYDFHSAISHIQAHNTEIHGFLSKIRSPKVRSAQNSRSLVRKDDYQQQAQSNGIPDYVCDIDTEKLDHGYHFDLSYVETVISHHEAVKACGVLKGESAHGQTLLALVETHPLASDWTQTVLEIRSHVAMALPQHMVPSHFIRVAEGLPQTESGNVYWSTSSSSAASVTDKLSTPGSCTPPDSCDGIDSEEIWQKEQEDHFQYWVSQLQNSQPAAFFYDRHRPAELSKRTLTQEFCIEDPVYRSVKGFCETSHVTVFSVLLASLRAAHFRMTGMTDANIGAISSSQIESECRGPAELPICLRLQVDDENSFEELVQHTQTTFDSAIQHWDGLLEAVFDRLGRPSDNPLFRIVFVMHQEYANQAWPNKSDANNINYLANYELEFHVYEHDNSISGEIRFASDLFTEPTIKALLSVFSEILKQSLQAPRGRIDSTPLPSAQEALQEMGLLDANSCDYPRTSSITDVFAQEVASNPDNVAVIDAVRQLTYAELDLESEHVANWVRGFSLPRDAVVAVFAPRSCEAIVAIMGILKADLAYAPMDHKWPDTRIATILASISSPRIVLLGADVKLPDISTPGLNMITVAQAIAQGSRAAVSTTIQRHPSPNSLAYIIFTSGSTGQPKGVMIEHRSVICRVRPSTNICAAGTAHKAVAHLASLAFDAATWEIYSALLNGGTVICIDTMTVLDYRQLEVVFAQYHVRVAFMTPAFLKECIAASPATIAHLESLAVGGDKLDPQVVFQARKLLGCGELINGYGPTENTIFSTKYTLTDGEAAVNGVPIGRAIPESGAYVMDTRQCLVPLGVLGELVVTGDGLARGYTDPERNKDTFIDVEINGHRVPAYRTGDRVRYRPEDGQIEYFGRMDNQVKIRGNRIELGEIEHTLLNQQGVDEAVVVVQKHHINGDQQLVAFITGSHLVLDPQQMRVNMKKKLPSYMIPAVITAIERMPINHNGKVDRRALAQMMVEAGHESSPADKAPRNETEDTICQEFSRVLGCTVGITDNFYSLGGHSLMGARVIFQVAQRLNCPLTMPDLIEAPTPEELAQRVASLRRDSDVPALFDDPESLHLSCMEEEGWEAAIQSIGLDRADIELAMPCSPFQEGVLSADMALGERSGYRATMYLSLNGELDVEALQHAWQATVAKEQMLRTVFLPVVRASSKIGIAGDSFLQAVLKEGSPEVQRVCTIGGLDGSDDSIDLHLGMGHIPLSFAMVPGTIRVPEFVMSIHHALYDGAYFSAIVTRLTEAYHRAKGFTLVQDDAADDIPYSTFIGSLQNSDQSQVSSFWKSYLQDAPCASWPLSVPPDAANREQQPPQEKTVSWKGDVRELARKYHTTPAAIGRAAVALVTAAHSDTDDVVLGEVSSGRHQSGFVAGPCIATHPVRLRLGATTDNTPLTFNTVVKAATESYARTMAHQHYGLAAIRRESEHPDQLPFQVLYVYQHAFQSSSHYPDKSGLSPHFTSRHADPGRVDFPLVIEAFCSEPTGHMDFHCTFDADVLSPEDAHWVMQHLVQALQAMDTSLGTEAISAQSSLLISAEEKERLLRMGQAETVTENANAPVETLCAHDIVHRQARKFPEKIALQFEQTDFVTYQQLDEQSTRLSHTICSVLAEHPGHGQPLVPICFDKSVDMVVAILAVLKAGAAYVPLDMEHPVSRLVAICEAINSRIIIWDGVHAHDKLRTVASQTNSTLWAMQDLRQMTPNTAPLLEPIKVSPDALAYVLFTSGSTGTPKGVMVEHRNIVAFMQASAGSTDCSWTSHRLALLAYTFDASVGDLFGTLGKGGRLSLVRRNHLMPALAKWLDDLTISHLALTPTMGTFLLNDLHAQDLPVPHLKTLVFGGEPFRREILTQASPEMNIWNGYGPTEAAIEVSACLLQDSRNPQLPPPHAPSFFSLGAPIHRNRIHLLRRDADDLVPIGAVGELCITGAQVSRGYLTHPDLTAKHFTASRFGRMYRTGDLARWHGDGSLEYLGRMDGQIKLRGLRIEPADIAAAAQSHPGVHACVVAKVHGPASCSSSEALVAVVHADPAVPAAAIHAAVAARVPAYMVPAHIHLHPTALPQTTSGKLDQRAIAALAEQEYHAWLTATAAAPPAEITRAAPDSLEARLAPHWAAVLGLPADGVDIATPFAQLGGDSLRAISLLAVLRRAGLSALTMADLRPTATIQTQAATLRAAASDVRAPPAHIHVYTRPGSVATVVLVHPFLGGSRSLEELVPRVDGRFDVILVDDPFFGTTAAPASLPEWARVYVHDVACLVPPAHRVVLGGYSFGGLIALEMALLWEAGRVASLVLLDPGTYAPTEVVGASEEERAATARAALSLLGVEEQGVASFQEHYERHNAVLARTRSPPVYAGRCLYVALPERVDDGVAEWWRAQCPALRMECVQCEDHYALLKAPVVDEVGEVVNRHCWESLE
ncbi:hypothetical protein BDV59DRAFT_204255 [Aspergillus ambiguus]|uniref:uncharacterized protein n=1 Tax=Aspergillus ambiguus TaxID=176160 RepID=UPI003CCDA1BF